LSIIFVPVEVKATNVETVPATAVTHREAFFRQSGWLMVANVGGGMLMWAVHFLSQRIGRTQYGEFGALLAAAMVIPTIPLQNVMAQQTAKALAADRPRELAGVLRFFAGGIFALWALASLVVLFCRQSILLNWNITDPAALWITLPVMLCCLLLPVFSGVLQGHQNFLWLGWSPILNGIGRLLLAVLTVFAIGMGATGLMIGVLVGSTAGLGVCVWHSRSIWRLSPLPFDWRSVLSQIIPLLLGFCAFQFLFTADTVFAQRYFDGDTVGCYVSAGTLSRALMWFVLPLATVMFPRLVHSAARSEKTDLMKLVLLGTAVLSIGGAIFLSLIGPFVVRFMSGAAFVKTASSLLPWYSGALVPLALANVLLNNLMARSMFKCVPALCLIAIGYGFALTRFHQQPADILKTLGVFNLLLFLVCAWFTWRKPAT
jgi:O-antigen/teichoic acid export membrane protein